MSFLRRLFPTLLVLGAVVVILVTLFTDHTDEYAKAELPGSDQVSLPAGGVKVFFNEHGGRLSDDDHNLEEPLSFQVVPVAGGKPVTIEPTTDDGTAEAMGTRSQAIGSAGAVADLEVPSAGDYRVSGSFGASAGTIEFGESPFSAVLKEWKIWCGMLFLALVISMIPVDRVGRRTGDGAAEDARSIPAGGPTITETPYTPYRG